jgi:hypothetical protein
MTIARRYAKKTLIICHHINLYAQICSICIIYISQPQADGTKGFVIPVALPSSKKKNKTALAAAATAGRGYPRWFLVGSRALNF